MNDYDKFQDDQDSEEEAHLDEAALDWVIRCDGGLTPQEQDEFMDWLAEDARHGEWFAQHRHEFGRFDSMVQWCPEHSDDPNPDLLANPWYQRTGWIGRSAMAAAVLVLLSLAVFSFREPSEHFNGYLPELGAMALEYQIHRMPDGSIVELNQGSQIQITYDNRERRVNLLSGEAYFEVAKNPDRPFIVRARGIDVKAVGTAFNVKVEGDSLEVIVTHGQVLMDASALEQSTEASSRISVPEFQPELSAGQRSHVSFKTTVIQPEVMTFSEEEVDQVLAWKHRVLEFVDRPLGEIVKEFNHFNTRQITVAGPELLETQITATFRSYNLDGFVRLLELTCPVEAHFESDDSITLVRVAP